MLPARRQNADDAGATVVKFCLDCRHHPTARLLDARLAPFQGPALLVYNDAVFSDKDFTSISRIGDSVKREQKGKVRPLPTSAQCLPPF